MIGQVSKQARALALSAVFGGFALASISAHAEEGLYFGGSLAVTSASDFDFNKGNANSATRTMSFDPGFGLDLRGGYDLGDWRAELELGYRTIGIDSVDPGSNASGDVNAYTVMINGAYDFDTGSEWTPYVGLGVGALIIEGDVSYTSSSNTAETETKNFYGAAPAAQVGLGVAFEVSDDVDLIGGYDLLGATSDDGDEDNVILMHSVTVGVNFNF